MLVVDFVKNWPCLVKGSIYKHVQHITEQLKDISANTMFFARKGERFNSLDFIEEAIEKGASVIVVDDEAFFRQTDLKVTLIWVPNCLKMIAYCASLFYGLPSEAIKIVAVTGTNGKTTTTHFIEQLLRMNDKKTLLIGTNGIFKNGEKLTSTNFTTLDAITFHNVLAEAVLQNIEYCIIEASSQGLAQHRLDFTNIDVGVYLNLGADHLEWHQSMENYKQAKLKLLPLAEQIVINGNDSFCKAVGIMTRKPKFSFGAKETSDFFYERLQSENKGSYLLQNKMENVLITFPFFESYNIENAIAAMTVCAVLELDLQKLAIQCNELKLPLGRMELFDHPNDFKIIVDYAHTAEALYALLSNIALNDKRKITIVFGCGGNRDRAKRKKMGEIASRFASTIILTADNCRDEQLAQINEDIKSGFKKIQHFIEIDNREQAIVYACKNATKDEIVVVAGKGHEQTQIINGQTLNLSDIHIIKQIIQKEKTTKKK